MEPILEDVIPKAVITDIVERLKQKASEHATKAQQQINYL